LEKTVEMKKTWVSIDYFYLLLFHLLINIHHKGLDSDNNDAGLSRQIKQEQMDVDVSTIHLSAFITAIKL